MSEPLPDLNPDALRLLQEFQRVGQRSPEAIDAALRASLGTAAAGGSTAAGSSVALKVLGAAAVLCGVVGVAAWVVDRAPAELPHASGVERVVKAPAASAGPVAPAEVGAVQLPASSASPGPQRLAPPVTDTAATPPGTQTPPSTQKVRRTTAPRRHRRASPAPGGPHAASQRAPESNAGSLVAELRLLRRARAALKAHDPKAALRVVAEHRREHADGELAEERDATEITAFCQLGLQSKAEAKAAAFERAFPGSDRDVLGACVSDVANDIESQ